MVTIAATLAAIAVASALAFMGLDRLTRHLPRLTHLRGAFSLRERPLARLCWAMTALMPSATAIGGNLDPGTMIRTSASVFVGTVVALWMTRHVPKAYRRPAPPVAEIGGTR